jgi:hypothetical protein
MVLRHQRESFDIENEPVRRPLRPQLSVALRRIARRKSATALRRFGRKADKIGLNLQVSGRSTRPCRPEIRLRSSPPLVYQLFPNRAVGPVRESVTMPVVAIPASLPDAGIVTPPKNCRERRCSSPAARRCFCRVYFFGAPLRALKRLIDIVDQIVRCL